MASVHDQIITSTNQSNAAQAAQDKANGKSASSTVSSQDFLKLMTMQLQYQDPMSPMDNSEMLAQEAQFSTLEQMEALTSSFSKFSSMYQANSLLGQNVEVAVGGNTTKGTVDYVDYSDSSGASISINGKMFPLSSITKVYPQGSSGETDTETKNFFITALDNIAGNLGYLAQKAYDHFEGGNTTGAENNTNTDNAGE